MNELKTPVLDDDLTSANAEELGSDAAADEPCNPQPQQGQLRIDESSTLTHYASLAKINGTAEEFSIDFSQGIRPTGANTATMKIDSRAILSPRAAKRLAISLGQAVQRYEQAYGAIEIDPQKRRAE